MIYNISISSIRLVIEFLIVPKIYSPWGKEN